MSVVCSWRCVPSILRVDDVCTPCYRAVMHCRVQPAAESPSTPRSVLEPLHGLAHPLWWVALISLVANDHVLKGSGLIEPGLTGKLSDISGMLVAPLLLAALSRARSRIGLLLCHVAVGIVFAAINLFPSIGALWSGAFALIGIPWRVWSDPSDLLVLPSLAISWRVFIPALQPTRPFQKARWFGRTAVVAGSLACLASSPWPPTLPAVVEGKVVVEHKKGVMFIVDAQSGAVLKTLASSGHNADRPAIQDHILYQVQRDGRVTGIDIDNPQTPFTLWKPRDAETHVRILRVDAHRLYVLSNGNELELLAVDRVYGKQIWSTPIEQSCLKEVTVEGDTLLVSDDQRVRAVNARTGEALWSFNAGESVGSAVVGAGIAYFASADGVVRGVAMSSGNEVWRFQTGDDACSSYQPRTFVSAGTVFACLDDATLAIGVAARKLLWTNEYRVVAIGEGVAMLRAESDKLVGVDANTGKLLWTRELDDDLSTSPLVAGGVAYVRNRVGKLYAVDITTGALRWTLDMDAHGEVLAVDATSVVIASK